MSNRVRTMMDTHGANYTRPWVVFVDGKRLCDRRGGTRRFKTQFAARDAGVREHARAQRSAGQPSPASKEDGNG